MRAAGGLPAALRRRRRLPGAAALAASAALALPARAHAHGLVARRDLPIPEWLASWVAAGVLIISFLALAAAWSTPRLSRAPWRPLPAPLDRWAASPAIRAAGGIVGVALLALVVVAGFAGSPAPTDNLTPTFVLIVFWVGLAFASIVFGNVFAVLNPWRALGRGAELALGRRARTPARAYPARLGCWPAVLGLLAFTWLELASGWSERPDRLAAVIVAYSVLTLTAMAFYGTETWLRRGEVFAVYFGLLARLSVFETRDGRVGLRPPLSGLSRAEALPGTVAFVTVMIGSVTYDGLSEGPAWRAVSSSLNSAWLSLGAPVETAVAISATLGLLACCLLVAAVYRLAIAGVAAALDGRRAPELERALVFSLIPIAMAYIAAHYLTLLLFEGQAIAYLASDPLGRGWDLFGTGSRGIDYSLLGAAAVWYLKVGLVVCGHVGGLVVAHDRALELAATQSQAVRSQYPMLAVMVAFTVLALWLLAQGSA